MCGAYYIVYVDHSLLHVYICSVQIIYVYNVILHYICIYEWKILILFLLYVLELKAIYNWSILYRSLSSEHFEKYLFLVFARRRKLWTINDSNCCSCDFIFLLRLINIEMDTYTFAFRILYICAFSNLHETSALTVVYVYLYLITLSSQRSFPLCSWHRVFPSERVPRWSDTSSALEAARFFFSPFVLWRNLLSSYR